MFLLQSDKGYLGKNGFDEGLINSDGSYSVIRHQEISHQSNEKSTQILKCRKEIAQKSKQSALFLL